MDKNLRASLGASTGSHQGARRGKNAATRFRRINQQGEKNMTSAIAVPAVENLIVSITQEIHVKASLEVTFAALLEQLGQGFDSPDGKPMPFVLEAFPGGRWFRDLGNGNGHFWAHVQAIKRPTLLEFYGPLMMSYAVASNVQYRLSEVD